MRRSLLILTLALTAALAAPRPALAVRVESITRMAGARTNVLTGMGLVIGLKGTGDGGAYMMAIKPLAELLTKFGNPATVADLSNANNVAIVQVTATMPRDGVHNGDHLDVQVMSTGAATSLRGGQLYMATLLDPTGHPFTQRDAAGNPVSARPYALANGPIALDDASVPTNGVVKGGATVEVDLPATYIDTRGRFQLIIDEPSASWTTAGTIAKQINDMADNGETVAVAVSPTDVVVQIPASERDRPDVFISNVQRLNVPMPPSEARVRINSKTGFMAITGDVEISPVVVNQAGLSISMMNPPQRPSAANPQRVTKGSVALDTTGTGGARLQDLADTFDMLKVPIKDRIEIVQQLVKLGSIHAKVKVDDVDQ